MKMTKSHLKASVLAALVGLASSHAIAGSSQITVPNNGTPENFNGGGTLPLISDNNTVQANGVSTYTGQAWDLEAFTATTVTGSKLSLVSGYDLSSVNGNYYTPGGGVGSYGGTGGGDIFISLSGGATDLPNSGAGYAKYVNNTLASGGNSTTPIYNYVIDTHQGLNAAGPLAVYALTASSMLTGVENTGLNSNPWIFEPTAGQQPVFYVSYTYTKNLTAAQVATATSVSSMNGLKDDNTSTGADGIYPWSDKRTNGLDHNLLTIDMSPLSAALASSTSIYFSYTMECGNDSIKGLSSGGFSQLVPDGGSTLILLGSALALLQFARRKQAA